MPELQAEMSIGEVINLLRQMDVPVRSHLSMLTDDQVARIRARWEREKRARAEKPAIAILDLLLRWPPTLPAQTTVTQVTLPQDHAVAACKR